MWTFSSAAAEHLAYIGVPNSGDFAWTFWTFGWETPAAGEHTVTSRAIAVSGSTRDFLVRERHVPAERVRLIWNGAPLDEFAHAPAGAREGVRAEWGLGPDAVAIGTIGRLSEQKGQRDLIDAASRVVRADPRARFVLVGDGDLRPYLPGAVCDLVESICDYERRPRQLDRVMVDRVADLYFTHTGRSQDPAPEASSDIGGRSFAA